MLLWMVHSYVRDLHSDKENVLAKALLKVLLKFLKLLNLLFLVTRERHMEKILSN